ncbi:HAMP domain-containing histidine kinase [Pedobacter frigiditerrae]|uniref:histidine kinase n=1 Tax=Pedobacter frigiditerrae TaxID=2530452 RepID=A0A4R0MR75_9SPHI|nr:HAMP domain-containing sensor histidine kinase [Pedobacter frigiditerrae]TCC89203.1 HAMP domain-containing histidine kinase [Pedobacter frigiditerrae]
MKLAQRYNRANLLTSSIILVITGVIYYIAIHFILTNKLDKDLVIEEKEIQAYVLNYGKLPSPGDFLHQKVAYVKLGNKKVNRNFFYDNYNRANEKESEPGRTLITSVIVNGQNYQVSISKSRAESEDLIRLIFFITLAVTILLLVSLLLINRFLLQSIWRPFYATLNTMKAFNLTAKTDIKAQQTNIEEFNELNIAVGSMADSVKKDYKELKTFTDNASHEMMTPLAVINSKLDLLLQGEALNPQQGELIDEIYNSVGRLGRLNHSLLLLAKIENKLIPEQETFNLKDLIVEKIKLFQELVNGKNITLTQNLLDKEIMMSKYLADILLNNLLSNAIRHNYNNGTITIDLNKTELIISNTSKDNTLDQAQAFERFYKTPSSEGMGLGLAMVKQIAGLHQFDITYTYQDKLHIFCLTF